MFFQLDEFSPAGFTTRGGHKEQTADMKRLPFVSNERPNAWQFFVTFLGWLSDLLERLTALQLGDEKVTLNHLADSEIRKTVSAYQW